MAKLDRKKSFGTIMGDTEGRAYEQDGKYFDADGDEYGVPKPKPAKAEAKTDGKAASANDDQLTNQ